MSSLWTGRGGCGVPTATPGVTRVTLLLSLLNACSACLGGEHTPVVHGATPQKYAEPAWLSGKVSGGAHMVL